MSLIAAAGALDQRPGPSDELRRQIVAMRGKATNGRRRRRPPHRRTTAIYHAKRAADRPDAALPAVVATLTLGGLRSANCARSTTSTWISLAADCACSTQRPGGHGASTSTTISKTDSPTRRRAEPRGCRAGQRSSTRRASAGHATRSHGTCFHPPRGGRPRAERRPPTGVREEVTPHTLRYTYIASLFAAGADRNASPTKSGTRTSRRQPHLPLRLAATTARRDRRRRQLAMHQSPRTSGVGGLADSHGRHDLRATQCGRRLPRCSFGDESRNRRSRRHRSRASSLAALEAPRQKRPHPGESRSTQAEPRIEDSEVRENRHRSAALPQTPALGRRATIASKDL